MSEQAAKAELDSLISDARFRCYRPIRVAEVLYKSRTQSDITITNPESYRVASNNWRDEMSRRLTGKGSTSSQSYQKDFSNLISADKLQILDDVNTENDGIVENYIYRQLKSKKWNGLIAAQEYVTSTAVDEFSFSEYMGLTKQSGLEEDAMLEIAVYALFKAITRELDAKAKLELGNPNREILREFDGFVHTFLGLGPGETSFETLVDIHRAGKGTYAADKGIDIGTNFGTMVQVKHISLNEKKAKEIEDTAYVNRVVVVCREAERDVIRSVSNQLGYEKVSGIVTIEELNDWYDQAFGSFQAAVGSKILSDLRRAFKKEFQSGDWRVPNVDSLLDERGYDESQLTGIWSDSS